MYASASMARLKAARRLTKRALRQRERAFLAEGPQAVSEALATGARVSGLFVTAPAQARHAELVAQAQDAGVDVQLVSGEVMSELAQTVTPQGLLAVCDFVDVPLAKVTDGQADPSRPAGERPGPGQRGHRAARRRRGGRGRGDLRRRLGRPLQRQVRPGQRGQPVPPAGRGRGAAAGDGRRAAAALACGSSPPTAGGATRSTTRGPGRRCARRPRGCSATRRGGFPTTCWRWPTSRSRCRSTAARNRSTSPPRRRCASMPPRRALFAPEARPPVPRRLIRPR